MGEADTTGPIGDGTGGAIPAGDPPRDDVMQVLAEFEQGLQGLKQLYTERQFLQAKLQQREVDLLLKENDAASRLAQAEQLRAEVERRQRDLEGEREKLASWRAEVEERQAQVSRAREELSKREAEARGALESFAQQKAEAEAIRAKLQAARKEIEQAARSSAELERRRAEMAHEVERVAKERAELESLRGQAAEAREQVEEAERALAEIQARRGELEEARQRADAGAGALAEERSRIEAARAELDRREADLAESLELVESLRERSAALLGVVEEYEQVREHERDEVKALTERLEASRAEVAELEGVVEQLRERLKDEVVRRREMEAEGADAALSEEVERLRGEVQRLRERGPVAAAPASERVARRAERLRAYRRALKERLETLRRGQEAMKKRFEQTEKVLAQRAEVARTHAAVTQMQRKLEKRAASRGASIAVLCVTIAMAVLGALSWAASKQMVAGEYVAKCVVRADGRGRELSEEEIREWTKFHEELVADPRFADSVSKRMGRKGMAELGSPGAVAEIIKNRLSVASPAPGEIWMELRGNGETRVERELDTISATLASEANMARTGQAFAAATLPPTPASTGGKPVDQSQLIAAGVMMGGGVIFTLFVGFLIWKRLASAKTKFERDAQLAAILDDTNWPDPAKLAA